jgi:hypothetical protein
MNLLNSYVSICKVGGCRQKGVVNFHQKYGVPVAETRGLAANSQKSLRYDIIFIIKSYRKHEYITFFNLLKSYVSICKVGGCRQRGLSFSTKSVGFRLWSSGEGMRGCVNELQKSLCYDIIITI